MGNAVFAPLCYAFKRILFNENGYWTGFKEALAYLFLEFKYKTKRKRLDLYNPWSSSAGSLESVNFKIPKEEKTLEYPRSLQHDDEEDSLFFCGFNKSGQKLITKISQNKKGLASVWLFLIVNDERKYTLSTQKAFRIPVRANKDSFVAGGLRMRCLQAMRKWRISYSGLLQQEEHSGSVKNVYVRFSFLWTASSFVYDVVSDISTKLFASYLAKEKWNGFSSNLNELNLNSYVQAGSMMGTYVIDEEPECEIYLWGARKRNTERISTTRTYSEVEFFAFSEEGEMLYFVLLNSEENRRNSLRHGCIVQKNSLGGAIDSSNVSEEDNKWTIHFSKDTFSWSGTLRKSDEAIPFCNMNGSIAWTSLVPVQLNDCQGSGAIIQTKWDCSNEKPLLPETYLPNLGEPNNALLALVVGLENPRCRETWLAGGKGASLADLHALSRDDPTFIVPKGIVVTSLAYEEFIKGAHLSDVISELETATWTKEPKDLSAKCESLSSRVEGLELPATIKKDIKEGLTAVFGADWEKHKFAVRSSASGEDSEDSSSAGQMKTFLGLIGFDEICNAVVKCWASQFMFLPVQYNRQNGQPVNSPMAVVIQEIVIAESAGVMFTCDPVTGNPNKITITANYGLGESVVSGSAEPDTIVLKHGDTKGPEIQSVQIGGKKIMTTLSDVGVTDKVIPDDLSSKSCLSEKQAMHIALLGMRIEEAFGCCLDIEWAFNEDKIFLLQARPVTTLHKETDFEIIHESDTSTRSEDEWFTTANVGEVYPGAASHLGFSSWTKFTEFTNAQHIGRRDKTILPFCPYYQRGVVFIANHVMFNVLDIMLRFYNGKHSLLTTIQSLSFSGRILDDPVMLERATQRYSCYPNVTAPLQIVYFLTDILFASRRLTRRLENYSLAQKFDIASELSAEEIFNRICHQWLTMTERLISHTECSLFSSSSSMFLLSVLLGSGQEITQVSTEVLGDVAFILSSCKDVESVEIPDALESIACDIINSSDYATFKNFDNKQALLWLQSTDTKAGHTFREFLKKNKHRCNKELDIMCVSWGEDPSPLVSTLQEIVARGNSNRKPRLSRNTNETIRNLKTSLTWKQRLLMKIVIPLCRKAVCLREKSKSFVVTIVDCMRHSYNLLADQMVVEGRLPDGQLIYFLSHFELLELLETRSPKLVQKAIRRKSLFPTIDKMIFPETSLGVPRPINFEKKEAVCSGDLVMKGVPVCQGIAIGKARVALDLEEASKVEAGEILIAYSTNIAWSPYFPVLAGLATELGGLISHGAVVAREYGLPCIVGIHGATMKFNTGDEVVLDGNKGTLTRLE